MTFHYTCRSQKKGGKMLNQGTEGFIEKKKLRLIYAGLECVNLRCF